MQACVTFVLETVGICNFCVGANLAAGIWGTIYLENGPTNYSESVGIHKYPRHLEMTQTLIQSVLLLWYLLQQTCD